MLYKFKIHSNIYGIKNYEYNSILKFNANHKSAKGGFDYIKITCKQNFTKYICALIKS